MDEKMEVAWEVLKPHVKAMVSDVVDKILFPAIDDAVAKTENKFDDSLVAMLKPLLLDAVKEQISHI